MFSVNFSNRFIFLTFFKGRRVQVKNFKRFIAGSRLCALMIVFLFIPFLAALGMFLLFGGTVQAQTDFGGYVKGDDGPVFSMGVFRIKVAPHGFEGTPATREIHTRVKSLKLTGPYSTEVRAGDLNLTHPLSPGEVESKDPTGNPSNDFPAQSFFDVFVEVDLPTVGVAPFDIPGGAMLINNVPLIVFNPTLTKPPGFPPTVVYLHENTTAVPVYFKNDYPYYWNAGDLFGYLVLAGHGIDSTAEGDTVKQHAFGNFVNSQPEMPLCGDVNGDGKVNVSDVIYLVNYLFKGGPLPIPELLVGDVNGDGKVTVSDVVYLINYLFKGGPPPSC